MACWQVHATKLPSAHVHTNTHTYTHAHTKQASPVLRRLPLSYQSVSQRDVAALQFKQLMQRETLSHSPASPHSPRTLPPQPHTHTRIHMYTCRALLWHSETNKGVGKRGSIFSRPSCCCSPLDAPHPSVCLKMKECFSYFVLGFSICNRKTCLLRCA